jgi:hypothetical protein
MSATRPVLVVALVLALPLTAAAWGHRPRTTAAYYYYPYAVPAPPAVFAQPAPVVAVPAPVVPAPAVSAPAPVFAVPAPAPACPTLPPMPSAAPVPGVNESRSNYTPAVTTSAKLANGAVRVSFWNHSTQDLTLRIDGETRSLGRGRGLTLELPRQFVWQIDGREAETERVPASEPGVEILIHR